MIKRILKAILVVAILAATGVFFLAKTAIEPIADLIPSEDAPVEMEMPSMPDPQVSLNAHGVTANADQIENVQGQLNKLNDLINKHGEANSEDKARLAESIIALSDQIESSMNALDADIIAAKEELVNTRISTRIAIEHVVEDYNNRIIMMERKQDSLDAYRVKQLIVANAKQIKKYERKLKRTNNPDKKAEYKAILKALKGQ